VPCHISGQWLTSGADGIVEGQALHVAGLLEAGCRRAAA
jgi:hypothetical protein